METNLIYDIALTYLNGVGGVMARALLAHFGSAEAVFQATAQQLAEVDGMTKAIAESILDPNVLEQAHREWQFVLENDIQVLRLNSAEYPSRLVMPRDIPAVLYYKGTPVLQQQRMVSVIGTRQATDYGRKWCEQFVSELRELDVCIVSGLAYGIDITAHRAALANGMNTVAVLGHGLNTLYPGEHRKTAQQIVQHGGLLSEYKCNEGIHVTNFAQRNRIVAALADAVVVVETDLKGGSMITVQMALDYKKPVFALPGKPGDRMSKGCNALIKQHKATLIESAADLVQALRWRQKTPRTQAQTSLFVQLSAEEKTLLGLLSSDKATPIDELSIRSGLNIGVISTCLLELECKALVQGLPGKRYLKC
jgi:DNA processing protein